MNCGCVYDSTLNGRYLLASASSSSSSSSVAVVAVVVVVVVVVISAPYLETNPELFTVATIALFSASEQTHCALVVCSCEWTIVASLVYLTESNTYTTYC